MHDRCSQETRNKQVPGKSPFPVLLPQDPTVCQTLPSDSFRRAFQDPDPEGTRSVLAAGLCRQAPIC
jgi:hypothetical protein